MQRLMKNALSRIMKKHLPAAHEECAGAHSEDRLRRNEEATCGGL